MKKKWRDDETQRLNGYFIDLDSDIRAVNYFNTKKNNNVFASKQQAKSAIAMARISQIMANDERFGGVITDEEWKDGTKAKYVITKQRGIISNDFFYVTYQSLAFHTEEQRTLFLEENMDLVKDYLMLD